MKYLLLLLILISASNLYAQIKTTGGGPDIKVLDSILQKDQMITMYPFMPTEKKFEVLKAVLLKIETKCTKTRTGINPGHTFMDSYYSLTFQNIRGSGSKVLTESECEQDNLVDRCLRTDELKGVMTEINKDPETYKYLESQFKLDKPSAKKVLDFFTKKPN